MFFLSMIFPIYNSLHLLADENIHQGVELVDEVNPEVHTGIIFRKK